LNFHRKIHNEIKNKIDVENNPIGKIIYGLLEVDESKRMSLNEIVEILKNQLKIMKMNYFHQMIY